jgi:hypothetical protein
MGSQRPPFGIGGRRGFCTGPDLFKRGERDLLRGRGSEEGLRLLTHHLLILEPFLASRAGREMVANLFPPCGGKKVQ